MKESLIEFRLRVLPKDHVDTGDTGMDLLQRVHANIHASIGIAFFNISSSYSKNGDLQRALDSAREALRIFRLVLSPVHPHVSLAQQQLVNTENSLHALSVAADDTNAHSDAASSLRDAGMIAITRHRGGGCAAPDYSLKFRNFNTFVAVVKLCCELFYWEVEVIDIVPVVQFGVCSEGFEKRDDAAGDGTGDDAFSWAVDGARMCKWHQGDRHSYGSSWSAGDTIGFLLDMRTVGAAVLSVGVNGSFAAPNGVAFAAIGAPSLSPALSASGGRYRLNFGERPFAHTPCDVGDFVSVHAFYDQQK